MSAYLTRRGLEQLREQLSERDLAVIHSVSQHRFVTAEQIKQLLFLDHTSADSAARVCRRVLTRLVRQRLLVRLQRRVGGVRAGSSSYVYALGAAGARLVDGRRFTEPSPLFLDHTLAIADAHVELVRADQQGRLELVSVEVEPACWRRYVGAGGAREIVRPDLRVVTAAGAYEDDWFVEIDRGTESPAAIRRKCRVYEGYWRAGFEQDVHGSFPLVLWVAPDERRATRLKMIISETARLKRELFRVISAEWLVEVIAGGAT